MGLARLLRRAHASGGGQSHPPQATPEPTPDAVERERRLIEQLVQLNRHGPDFLGSVGHELRAPVASVLGCAELLLDGSIATATPQQRMMLLRIDREGRRLERHVEDLFTLNEIVAGTLELEKAPVDLTTVVRRAVEMVTPTLAESRVALHVNMSRATVPVSGDAARLERVVTGLLANASKFTPEGGKVTLSLSREGSGCVLSVTDAGIGVPRDHLDGVFNSFFRSSAAYDRAVPGTGLGLAIARALVELHEGSLSVDSRLGHGNTVTVRLDCAEQLAA